MNQHYELRFGTNGKPTSSSFTRAALGNFKSPVLTHDAAGDPLLFAVSADSDKNQVYGMKLHADGTPNGGLFKVASGQVKELVVGHDAANTPEIFVSESTTSKRADEWSHIKSPGRLTIEGDGPMEPDHPTDGRVLSVCGRALRADQGPR